MIKKKQIFIAALFSGLSLYAADESSLKEKAATALANADAAIAQATEKVGAAVQSAVDAAEGAVQTVVDTAQEIADNIKKTEEEEKEEDADADYTIGLCGTAEIENVHQLLDTALACFKKIHVYAQKNEEIPNELAAEVQAYAASEEVMDAVLLYAWQKGDLEVALTILSFIRAEAFVKGAEYRTRAGDNDSIWSSDEEADEDVDSGYKSDSGSVNSWDWGSSDSDSDSDISELAVPANSGYQKIIAATTLVTVGVITAAWYYKFFRQPGIVIPGLD